MVLSVRAACVLLLGFSSAFTVRGQSIINETTLLVQEVRPVPSQRNGPTLTFPHQLRLAYAAGVLTVVQVYLLKLVSRHGSL